MGAQEVGRRIRAARTYAGFDGRKEFAARIQFSEPTLQRTENGERAAKRSELLAIAEACAVPMWFLEGGWEGWRVKLDEDFQKLDQAGRAAAADLHRKSTRPEKTRRQA